MRIDEIVDDNDFNRKMNKIIGPVSKKQEYPYLVLHPLDHVAGVNIVDMPDLDDFYEAWSQMPDNVQQEFGWDSPVITDGNMEPIEYNNDLIMEQGINKVIPMTFDKYVSIVAQSTD